MTKYVAEILKQLGIDYKLYNIRNHRDEESGETWITLHPRTDWREAQSVLERADKLYQKAFGKYKVYWDEKSCYLKISGILEIYPNGEQVFPTPTVDKPAMFSKDYILELRKNNQDYIPELICNEDYDPEDEEPLVDDKIRETYLRPNNNAEVETPDVSTTIDDEEEEEELSLKGGKRFGEKRNYT